MGTVELSLLMRSSGNMLFACRISSALVAASEWETTNGGDNLHFSVDFMPRSGGRNLYKSVFLGVSIQKINGVGNSVCFYNRQRI